MRRWQWRSPLVPSYMGNFMRQLGTPGLVPHHARASTGSTTRYCLRAHGRALPSHGAQGDDQGDPGGGQAAGQPAGQPQRQAVQRLRLGVPRRGRGRAPVPPLPEGGGALRPCAHHLCTSLGHSRRSSPVRREQLMGTPDGHTCCLCELQHRLLCCRNRAGTQEAPAAAAANPAPAWLPWRPRGSACRPAQPGSSPHLPGPTMEAGALGMVYLVEHIEALVTVPDGVVQPRAHHRYQACWRLLTSRRPASLASNRAAVASWCARHGPRQTQSEALCPWWGCSALRCWHPTRH